MSKIRKPAAHLFTLLAIAFTASLFFVSCNNNPPGSVVIEIPKDNSGLDSIDHFLPEALVKEYKSAFKIQHDSFKNVFPSLVIPESEAFNKRALLALLKSPDCVGIRIYHGVKNGNGKKNELRLVLVGVNSKGQDILIDKNSILAARVTDDLGGLEYGQCPSCQNEDQ